ncbi:MAG: divergent PAP2 family protein [Parcubacteria group bacterium]
MSFDSLELLIVPIAAGLIVQAIKLLTDGIRGNFDFKHMWASYGGMPSSHAAFVAALATEVGLKEGIESTAFAIAAVFGILILRDALGLRTHIGRQGKALNALIRNYHPDAQDAIPPLEERIGHTPAQLIIGAMLGVLIVLAVKILT